MIDWAFQGWLPIHLHYSPDTQVRWVETGPNPLVDPFFSQTIARVTQSAAPPNEKFTDISTMVVAASRLEPVTPAGFIFHISRCGSTLLSNALRIAESVCVVSEAQPFHSTLMEAMNQPVSFRRSVLRSLARVYGHSSGYRKRLIIKFTTTNILSVALIRSVWPETPAVILIRDPVEVIVSCMSGAPGWLRFREWTANVEVWRELDFAAMSTEEYCARVLGLFCERAQDSLTPSCKVVDYAKLDAAKIVELAGHFGVDMQCGHDCGLTDVLDKYSKDPSRQRTFAQDREAKQKAATSAIRNAAARWACPFYEELKCHVSI